tara:strand:- start:825 stop:1046 length:222 start_codon:yes stop_codon:yes gene_type:complete
MELDKIALKDKEGSLLSLKQHYTVLRNTSIREITKIIEQAEKANKESLKMHANNLAISEMALTVLEEKFEVIK